MLSAWNGSLEVHQFRDGKETVDLIPDLREFNPDAQKVETASFDAMNSNRVYRKKLTKEDIINEIEKNKGTQFDPKIADVFLKIIKSGKGI